MCVYIYIYIEREREREREAFVCGKIEIMHGIRGENYNFIVWG